MHPKFCTHAQSLHNTIQIVLNFALEIRHFYHINRQYLHISINNDQCFGGSFWTWWKKRQQSLITSIITKKVEIDWWSCDVYESVQYVERLQKFVLPRCLGMKCFILQKKSEHCPIFYDYRFEIYMCLGNFAGKLLEQKPFIFAFKHKIGVRIVIAYLFSALENLELKDRLSLWICFHIIYLVCIWNGYDHLFVCI